MSRLKNRVSWVFAAAAVVVLLAQVAEAQREGGRRGRGGGGFGRGGGFPVSSIQLVAEVDEVQTAINLTDEQKTKVEEINDQLRRDRRAVFQEGGRDFRAARGEMEKLNQDATGKLAEILDEGQQKQLAGISIQVNGAASLREPLVAKQLTVTEEQNEKLAEVSESNREARGDMRDISREERRALRAEEDKKLLAVLTSEQQEQYESLKGEPVDIDMRQLQRGGRGPDGEGRRGGRDRNRNRADRDNDEADAGSSDSN